LIAHLFSFSFGRFFMSDGFSPRVHCFQHFQDVLENPDDPRHPRVPWDWGKAGLPEDLNEEYRADVEEAARRLLFSFLGDLLKRLAVFFCENGNSKVEGAGIRAFVFGWCVLPALGRLSQRELAELMNRKHKQSVGREVSRFRDLFGFVCDHMQCEAARQAARDRQREVASRKKRDVASIVPIPLAAGASCADGGSVTLHPTLHPNSSSSLLL
jgi:hypothetical protein